MKLSRAALRPLLAAHERGALPLVGAAWGVTARKASHDASNARGVTARKASHDASNARGVAAGRWDATLVQVIHTNDIGGLAI